ncbi:MAG: hypothetical protein MZV70_71290 [Desulfobacterales bacterium]|nr:hypothetical protein [Desulfobacterales bacterium]
MGAPWVMAGLFVAVGGSAIWLFHKTPSEYCASGGPWGILHSGERPRGLLICLHRGAHE